MILGRLLEKYLLEIPSERPFRYLLRNFLFALGTAFAVCGISLLLERSIDWSYFWGILLVTNGLFFFGSGSERLWYATIFKMLENPLTLKAYLTHIPFWFIGGGIGFSLALLLAYKLGLVYILIAPQWKIFVWGGIFQFLIQIPLQILQFRILNKKIKKI